MRRRAPPGLLEGSYRYFCKPPPLAGGARRRPPGPPLRRCAGNRRSWEECSPQTAGAFSFSETGPWKKPLFQSAEKEPAPFYSRGIIAQVRSRRNGLLFGTFLPLRQGSEKCQAHKEQREPPSRRRGRPPQGQFRLRRGPHQLRRRGEQPRQQQKDARRQKTVKKAE